MLRERHKVRTTEAESINAVFSGGPGCSSGEASVTEMERRAGVKLPGLLTFEMGKTPKVPKPVI